MLYTYHPAQMEEGRRFLVDEYVLHLQYLIFLNEKNCPEECRGAAKSMKSVKICRLPYDPAPHVNKLTSLSKQAKCKQASPLGSSPYALTVTIIWICNV